jgi:hypothetical protein
VQWRCSWAWLGQRGRAGWTLPSGRAQQLARPLHSGRCGWPPQAGRRRPLQSPTSSLSPRSLHARYSMTGTSATVTGMLFIRALQAGSRWGQCHRASACRQGVAAAERLPTSRAAARRDPTQAPGRCGRPRSAVKGSQLQHGQGQPRAAQARAAGSRQAGSCRAPEDGGPPQDEFDRHNLPIGRRGGGDDVLQPAGNHGDHAHLRAGTPCSMHPARDRHGLPGRPHKHACAHACCTHARFPLPLLMRWPEAAQPPTNAPRQPPQS